MCARLLRADIFDAFLRVLFRSVVYKDVEFAKFGDGALDELSAKRLISEYRPG